MVTARRRSATLVALAVPGKEDPLRKLAVLLAAAPLLAVAQEATPPPSQAPAQQPPAYVPPPPAQPAPAPPPAAQPTQYAPPPPQYAPPPQYTPPPPAPPQPPYQRPPKQRDSWYIGFGFGGGDGSVSGQGSSLSFKEMNLDRSPTTLFYNFKVGATLSPRLLMGFDLSGVSSTAEGSGVTTSVGISNVDAMITFFPMERGFFLRGGLGLSALVYTIEDATGKDEWSPSGFNVAGGLGYAFWLGQSFNLTLNLDASRQWYGSSSLDPEDSTFWSAWVGFDWY